MQPKEYPSIVDKVLGFKAQEGIKIKYDQKDLSIGISTDNNFKNSAFTGTFKIPAGSIEIGMPSNKPLDIKIKPDLSAHQANLTIYPLKEGQYEFGLKKNLACIPLAFNFKSADSSYNVAANPKFNYGPFAFDVSAEYDGKNVTAKCIADSAKLGIRTKYSQVDKQLNLGLFSNLCSFKFGATTAVDVTNLGVKEVKAYIGSFKKASNVGFVFNIHPTFEFEIYGQTLLPKKLNFVNVANSIVYSGNKYALKSGFTVNCPNGYKFGAVFSDKLNLALYLNTPKSNGASLGLNLSLAKISLDKQALDPKCGLTLTFEAENKE